MTDRFSQGNRDAERQAAQQKQKADQAAADKERQQRITDAANPKRPVDKPHPWPTPFYKKGVTS